MKKVYLVGDSISLKYNEPLKALLNGKCIFSRKGDENEIKEAIKNLNDPYGANGGDSFEVLEHLNKLKSEKFKCDILLLNAGLHDIRRDREDNSIQTRKMDYELNLKKIIAVGKKMAKKVIWISTTHVVDEIHNMREGGYLRFNADVEEYNYIANEVMKKEKIQIIDLNSFTKELKVTPLYKDHVHFTEEVSKLQAEYIYERIVGVL